jgi:hypothetical protein
MSKEESHSRGISQNARRFSTNDKPSSESKGGRVEDESNKGARKCVRCDESKSKVSFRVLEKTGFVRSVCLDCERKANREKSSRCRESLPPDIKRIKNIFSKMRARTVSPLSPDYKNYGARGISICDEWRDFDNFYKWSIGNGYDKSLTIDRIDNDGDYTPNNCRWVGRDIQAQNRRSNHLNENLVGKILMWNSDGMRTCDIARKLDIPRSAIRGVLSGITWHEAVANIKNHEYIKGETIES